MIYRKATLISKQPRRLPEVHTDCRVKIANRRLELEFESEDGVRVWRGRLLKAGYYKLRLIGQKWKGYAFLDRKREILEGDWFEDKEKGTCTIRLTA